MNKVNFQKAINKYVILFSISYLLSLIWLYFAFNYFSQLLIEKDYKYVEYLSYIPKLIEYASNVIFTILVYIDLKSNKIKSHLIVVITLFFGILGVALFFIQLLYNLHVNNIKAQE